MSREPQEIKTVEQYHALLDYIAEERQRRGIDNRTEDEKADAENPHEKLSQRIRRYTNATHIY